MVAICIICVLFALSCLGFAGYIWHKRKQLDISTDKSNALLLQEQVNLTKRNEELRQSCEQKLQEFDIIVEKITISNDTLNELDQQQQNSKAALEKLNNTRVMKEAHLEVLNANVSALERRENDAMTRLNAIENSIEIREKQQEETLRRAFEKYAENLGLEEEKLEREYDELEKKLKQSYTDQQEAFEVLSIQKIEEMKNLELKLTDVYSERQLELAAELAQVREELDKIRATKAAAMEAQRREQEIKEKATFYTLQLNEADKTDISYLRSIEHNLREARPLRMLIWTTFYRDKANELAARTGAANSCGIYKLTHIDSGISYIGQARNIKDRWIEHIKCSLGIDTPVTSQLYAFTREKGIENFTFEVLELCSVAELNEKEKTYIDIYQTYDFGLNKTRGNK